MGNQIIRLEDEADLLVPIVVPIGILEGGGVGPIDQEGPFVMDIQTPDDVEEGRLPAAAGSKDHVETGRPKSQVDGIEGFEIPLVDLVAFRNAF